MWKENLLYRAFRASANGFSAWLFALLAITLAPIDWALAIPLVIASIDAFFDVMMILGFKVKSHPALRILNYFTEGMVVVICFTIFFFSFIYYQYFESYFFHALMLVSAIQMISAIIDLTEQFRPRLKKSLLGGAGKYVVVGR